MKQILKLLTAVICMCFLVQCKSDAQTITKEDLKNSTPEQRAAFITDTMTSILNLSADQHDKVYAINLCIAKKVSVVMQSDDGKMSKFKQIKLLQEERDSSLQNVLSSEQYDLYKQKVNELMQKMKEQYNNKKNNQ